MDTDLVVRAQRGDKEAYADLAFNIADRDVTVLSGDVTSATPDEIRALDVIVTIVDGIVVYCSETEVCGGD